MLVDMEIGGRYSALSENSILGLRCLVCGHSSCMATNCPSIASVQIVCIHGGFRHVLWDAGAAITSPDLRLQVFCGNRLYLAPSRKDFFEQYPKHRGQDHSFNSFLTPISRKSMNMQTHRCGIMRCVLMCVACILSVPVVLFFDCAFVSVACPGSVQLGLRLFGDLASVKEAP